MAGGKLAAIAFARDAVSGRPLWQALDKLLIVAAAFVLFCMAASAIYLINDLVDIEKDRAHPKKEAAPAGLGAAQPGAGQAGGGAAVA